jgi:hypothetical protein
MEQQEQQNQSGQENLLRLVHELIRCIDSGKTTYMFVVAVMDDGTAYSSVAGKYDPYHVAGFVMTRANKLVEQHEAQHIDDDDEKETAHG